MISLNTNISSLITQQSLTSSTDKLNEAIERMSTGFKINHAKDNAANYSISTNMTTRIGAYQVAEDNASMGLDMVGTATENLTQIETSLSRLRAIVVQTQNGTYGSKSLESINAEANSIIDSIEQTQNSAEYNGVKLTKETTGLIVDIERRDTSNMKKLEEVKDDEFLSSGTYSISTPEELAQLAVMTNNGKIGQNTEFVLANDIDLEKYCMENFASGGTGWTPIGTNEKSFYASFDGNGYTITNLQINAPDMEYVGLFGKVYVGKIKNVKLEDVDVLGKIHVGALVGMLNGTGAIIDNSAVSGYITGRKDYIGGLCGHQAGACEINNSYSNCIVKALGLDGVQSSYVGGLVGVTSSSCEVNNCFATGDVSGYANYISGFIGVLLNSKINNSYSTGSIQGKDFVAGFTAVMAGNAKIENSYTASEVSGRTEVSAFVSYLGWDSFIQPNIIEHCQVLSASKNLDSIWGSFARSGFQGLVLDNCSYNSVYDTYGTPLTTVPSYVTFNNIKTCDSVAPFVINTDGVINNSVNPITLQIGKDAKETSSINVSIDYELKGLSLLRNIGKSRYDYISLIDSLLNTVSEKQTELGAVSNRLESVLEEIAIQYDNLVSSRSTLRDADMAELSSTYIQQQILQQASATLMSTANQAPSIALQLI